MLFRYVRCLYVSLFLNASRTQEHSRQLTLILVMHMCWAGGECGVPRCSGGRRTCTLRAWHTAAQCPSGHTPAGTPAISAAASGVPCIGLTAARILPACSERCCCAAGGCGRAVRRTPQYMASWTNAVAGQRLQSMGCSLNIAGARRPTYGQLGAARSGKEACCNPYPKALYSGLPAAADRLR